MADGDSKGHNFFKIAEIEVEPFVDRTRRDAVAPVSLTRSLADHSVLCENRSHFENRPYGLSRCY